MVTPRKKDHTFRVVSSQVKLSGEPVERTKERIGYSMSGCKEVLVSLGVRRF